MRLGMVVVTWWAGDPRVQLAAVCMSSALRSPPTPWAFPYAEIR